ncbi:MAG: transposase [Bacteroidales bacterium]|nr:transposase [Bacteroidales bacterium]
MKTFFNDISVKEFKNIFYNEEKCLEYLANEKWKDGYKCKKCGNKNYCKGKKSFSRRCTKCKYEESATSHTLFHHCKISLTDAFYITYLVCNTTKISSYELSRRINIRQMTCWNFKKKIIECIDKRDDLSLIEKKDLKTIFNK